MCLSPTYTSCYYYAHQYSHNGSELQLIKMLTG